MKSNPKNKGGLDKPITPTDSSTNRQELNTENTTHPNKPSFREDPQPDVLVTDDLNPIDTENKHDPSLLGPLLCDASTPSCPADLSCNTIVQTAASFYLPGGNFALNGAFNVCFDTSQLTHRISACITNAQRPLPGCTTITVNICVNQIIVSGCIPYIAYAHLSESSSIRCESFELCQSISYQGVAEVNHAICIQPSTAPIGNVDFNQIRVHHGTPVSCNGSVVSLPITFDLSQVIICITTGCG